MSLKYFLCLHIVTLIMFSSLVFVESGLANEGYFSQTINHGDESIGNFKQRYFSNLIHNHMNTDILPVIDRRAPVLLVLCGESRCSPTFIRNVEFISREFYSPVFVLEHRYYGKSSPFEKLTTSNLKYLNIEMALDDVYNFQKYAQQKYDLPSNQWIIIGGSYAGTLAAFYKIKYPQEVLGVLASSAPIDLKFEIPEHDEWVANQLDSKCLASVKKSIQYLESLPEGSIKFSDFRNQTNSKFVSHDKMSVIYFYADAINIAVENGFSQVFCNEVDERGGIDGVVSFANLMQRKYDFDISIYNVVTASQPLVANPDMMMRQWMYQSCREIGLFQVANKNSSDSARSMSIDRKFFQNICHNLFGSMENRASYIHKKYVVPLLTKTDQNIIFTNGELDPWSLVSVLPQSIDPSWNQISILIPGAYHTADISGARGNNELDIARQKIVQIIQSWLRAVEKKRH